MILTIAVFITTTHNKRNKIKMELAVFILVYKSSLGCIYCEFNDNNNKVDFIGVYAFYRPLRSELLPSLRSGSNSDHAGR